MPGKGRNFFLIVGYSRIVAFVTSWGNWKYWVQVGRHLGYFTLSHAVCYPLSTSSESICKMSKKQTPSDFLKQIIGRPVVVKLNNGVDYRGKQQFSACEGKSCPRLWTFVRNSNVLYEMVLLQIRKVGEMEFVLWNLVPAPTPPSKMMYSLSSKLCCPY